MDNRGGAAHTCKHTSICLVPIHARIQPVRAGPLLYTSSLPGACKVFGEVVGSNSSIPVMVLITRGSLISNSTGKMVCISF